MIRLVYTFSKKISGEFLNEYLDLLKRSYIHNSKYHPIVLYTDIDTYPLVRDIVENVNIIENINVVFMDDLKMCIIKQLKPTDILADFDIFLTSPISLPEGFDLVIDIREHLNTNFDYKRILNHLSAQGVDLYRKNIQYLCNVGFFKIYNMSLLNSIHKNYYRVRDWYIDNSIKETLGRTKFEPSVIALQYQLEILCRDSSYSISELRNTNKYFHLTGADKFKNLELFNQII